MTVGKTEVGEMKPNPLSYLFASAKPIFKWIAPTVITCGQGQTMPNGLVVSIGSKRSVHQTVFLQHEQQMIFSGIAWY